MRRGLLVLCCLLSLVCVARVEAVEYFVDTTCAGCNDSNTCLQAQTVTTGRRTINGGIACLNPGDTLTIKAGTYPEYIHDVTNTGCPTCERIPAGTNWAAATIVQGAPGETVRLRPAFVTNAGFIVKFKAATDLSHYIILKNLIIDGILYTGNGPYLGGMGIYGPNHHIRCDGCTITDTRGEGQFQVSHFSCCSGATSIGNEFINGVIQYGGSKLTGPFTDGPGEWGHCVYISTSGTVIRNNRISDCAGLAISVYRSVKYNLDTDNNIIEGNTITRNGSCRTVANPNCNSLNDEESALGVGGNGNKVLNNVLYDVRNGGIVVGNNDPDGNLVANNTVCGVLGRINHRGIRVKAEAGTTTVLNNIVYRASPPFVNEGVDTVQSPNSFHTTTSPGFVTPCTDMHLTSSSPVAARTGGVNLSETFSTDQAGHARTVPWSMGAFEFGQSSGVLHLAFSTPPAAAVEGALLAPVRVQVLNEVSALQTGHAATCVLSKASGPGTLGGTLNVAPVAGVCTWSTLSLSLAGTYQLLVTSTGTTSATSPVFTITAPAVTPVAAVKFRGRR